MTSSQVRSDGTWLVALAAVLWGTDGLFRLSLAQSTPATTIVLAEHAILVLLTLPWLTSAVRAARLVCTPADWAALLVIGAGASAGATFLFTRAFTYGDPITPLALQKMQPLFATAGAALLLGERLRPRFGLFLVVALASGWLLAFADPLHVTIAGVVSALLALGAAALWAAGTVAGRLVSGRLGYRDLTTLRFAIGLPTALILTAWYGDRLAPRSGDLPALVGLAIVPGLLALLLYYRGLRRTPAARATLAELAFPATAAVVGVVFLDHPLGLSQWLGLVLLSATVVGFARHERRGRKPAVVVPPQPRETLSMAGGTA